MGQVQNSATAASTAPADASRKLQSHLAVYGPQTPILDGSHRLPAIIGWGALLPKPDFSLAQLRNEQLWSDRFWRKADGQAPMA